MAFHCSTIVLIGMLMMAGLLSRNLQYGLWALVVFVLWIYVMTRRSRRPRRPKR